MPRRAAIAGADAYSPAMTSPLRALSLDELRRRSSRKWVEYPDDVLPLWIAEMDVPVAEPVVRAVTEALAAGDTGYPSGTAYAEALADFAGARWGWRPAIERTLVVPDVMTGIVEVLKLVTAPGDAVVVNSPVYPPFYGFIANAGRRAVSAPLTPEGRLDVDATEAAFARATEGGRRAAYLLCSPQNPTGTVHTREELVAVNAAANAHGVRVVVDEIHAPLTLAGASHVPYLSLPDTEHAFALVSATKAWHLAGLKAGLAIAGREAAADLARIPEEVADGPSHVGVIAHTVALRDAVDWLDALLAGLDENRRLLADLLAEHLPAVAYRPPAATYLAWLDCRALGVGDDPAEAFLEHGRVALMAGPPFGPGGEGHVRLNIATAPEIVAEGVRRMAASL
jgi:cysteine-S-conjugate beta-lyase